MGVEFPTQQVVNPEDEARARAFDALFDDTAAQEGLGVPRVRYELPYPKEDFLRHLTEKRGFLLHGSPAHDLEGLEPRQANDGSKKSGNKNAVYAVTDPVFPIFYAIQDRTKISGVIQSGSTRDSNGEEVYEFALPKTAAGKNPWKRGVVYILDKETFRSEVDDHGDPSGEWTSDAPVKPLAVLEVSPEDFRFLDQVEYTTERQKEAK